MTDDSKYRDFTEKEMKWIKEFQKLMKRAPDTLFLFAGAGSLVVYPKNERNHRYVRFAAGGDLVDGNAPNIHISTKAEIDGGDW